MSILLQVDFPFAGPWGKAMTEALQGLARKFHWPAKVVILDGDLDGWRGLGGVLPKY